MRPHYSSLPNSSSASNEATLPAYATPQQSFNTSLALSGPPPQQTFRYAAASSSGNWTQGSITPYPATLRHEDFQSLSLNNSFLDTRNPAASFSPYHQLHSAEQLENEQFRSMFSLNPTEDDYAAGTQYFEHNYDASIPTDAPGMQSDHAALWDDGQAQQDHTAEPTSFGHANNDYPGEGTSLVLSQQTSHYSDGTTANDIFYPQNPGIASSYPSHLDDGVFETMPLDANTWAPIPRIAHIEPPPEVISMYQKAFSPAANDETPDWERLQRPEMSAAIESALMHFEFSMYADGSQRIADDTSNYFNLEPRLTADTIRGVAGQMRNTLQAQVTNLDLLTGHPVPDQLDTTTPSISTQTTDTRSKRTASTAEFGEDTGAGTKRRSTVNPKNEKPQAGKDLRSYTIAEITTKPRLLTHKGADQIATWLDELTPFPDFNQREALITAIQNRGSKAVRSRFKNALGKKQASDFMATGLIAPQKKQLDALKNNIQADDLTGHSITDIIANSTLLKQKRCG